MKFSPLRSARGTRNQWVWVAQTGAQGRGRRGFRGWVGTDGPAAVMGSGVPCGPVYWCLGVGDVGVWVWRVNSLVSGCMAFGVTLMAVGWCVWGIGELGWQKKIGVPSAAGWQI